MSQAFINRSIRTVQAELNFLADSGVLTHSALSNILAQLPALDTPATTTTTATTTAVAVAVEPAAPVLNPVAKGKACAVQDPTPSPAAVPPPSYTPHDTNTFTCTAQWAYPGAAEGDLSFNAGDKILVLKKENTEWWSGQVLGPAGEAKSEVGIFPCSYVKVDDVPMEEKSAKKHVPGDMGTSQALYSGNKEEGDSAGKRFGKKLGNAAIFGAGATIGGKIVNGIF